MPIISATIQLRQDTAASWTSSNPVLDAGEPGVETDTGSWKMGDGSTAWTSLGYVVGATGPQGIQGPAGSGVYDFAKRSSTSTGTAGPQLIIPWQTELAAGTDITWSSGNNTRLTIGADGTYKIGGYLTYSTTTQRGQANGQVLIDGTWEGDFRGDTYIRNAGSSWDFGVVEISSEPFVMTSGQYFELALARTSGANATYGTGGTGTITLRGESCRVWVERVA